MKIAFLLNGYVRNSLDEYDFYYDIFFKYFEDYDLFIHTWETDGFKKNGLVDKRVKKVYSEKKVNIDKLIKIYNPTDILVEDINKTKYPEKPKWMKLKTSKYFFKDYYFQAYGIYKSYLLKEKYENEHNIKYDYCIKLRFDLKNHFKRKNYHEIFTDNILKLTLKNNNFNHHDYVFVMENKNAEKFYHNLLRMVEYDYLIKICPFIKTGWKFVIDTWLISLFNFYC